ncbi:MULTISPECIES: tyrosine-type recombinase/integrase [unclassified Marinobacter]|jgi:integrase|uniref:tyrosine-type recombinase/integrase n=1 Tax=unclassified Marinobacter TaxID=83889 RepID=UPI00200FB95B|nr:MULTISPECIES: tyrosine-type recombinase/integrase [unclassified Marinobacter]UQG55099.1 tyrosine-type recombinase/integrase [Marinobacter sp. M4C]UQG55102.1 tyrosine-type recombinase/integrase [Marinobacter sp. M4C]UQG55917.1 tyrosine-type recombinase/integrase [Marinobacter sp. M4C]UQG57294.1 tyrosine-type recombinase/integrase [Marinobacter sp. M4C]UQG57354.1 tyrosine-type recombinase/integrase [Marinobacter sp. M4C]
MNTPETFAPTVEAYLNYRRQAGFLLKIEGEQLERFARFSERIGHQGPLTIKLSEQWACASRQHKRITAARRIEVLRPFARYCLQFNPATEIPPRGLFGRAHRRLTPHIYTDAEICALLEACASLPPSGGLRGASCATIFGLIASTGLRISEATGLQRPDVDLEHGLLHIRNAKFGKSRWVPLHSTTTNALQDYERLRDNHPLAANTKAFFVFDYGRSASISSVEYAFKLLRQQLKWRSRGDHPAPRIHDLRHSFVCHNLERWYAQNIDIEHHILALSTYLGHAKITDTYWYLTATPELLAKAALRPELYQGELL